MTRKPVIPRQKAVQDVQEALEYDLQHAGASVALGLLEALEQAYAHIGAHPQTGSLRYAHELDLPDLRMWSLGRYPYLVFYVDAAERIDVWRILHAQRNLPAWLQEGGGSL